MLPQALRTHFASQYWGVLPGFGMVRPQRASNTPAVSCQIRQQVEPVRSAVQRRKVYGSPQSGSDWRCRRTIG